MTALLCRELWACLDSPASTFSHPLSPIHGPYPSLKSSRSHCRFCLAPSPLSSPQTLGESESLAIPPADDSIHLSVSATTSNSASSDASDVDERERKRRERIGLANKGRTPWNKGKPHSPATIARMRERNKIVMQDPKIREKLRQHVRPQSQETREKLRKIMKSRMEYERKQLTIVQEWKDIVAEDARIGYMGDDELQWDSYDTLKEELRQEYFKSKLKKKERVRRSWSMEQRLRISESVRAKWEDPHFRNMVIQNIREKRLKGMRRKKSNAYISDVEFDNLLDILTRTPSSEDQDGSSETKIGSYSDPSSKEKLAKLRQIKFQGRTVNAQKKDDHHHVRKNSVRGIDVDGLQQKHLDAAEKARILLAEAEEAAMLAAQALEAAGARDANLAHSLLEARTLLDEANKSILNTQFVNSHRNGC